MAYNILIRNDFTKLKWGLTLEQLESMHQPHFLMFQLNQVHQ